jgi:hypothetical protein
MSEAAMWNTLRPVLVQSVRDDAVRVENPAWPGTPDVHWCMDGIEGWLELKEVPEWPKRPGTPLRIDHYTSQQRVWQRRRYNAGGRVHVLIKVSDDWLLFDVLTAISIIGEADRTKLIERCKLWCRPLDGEMLRAELKS